MDEVLCHLGFSWRMIARYRSSSALYSCLPLSEEDPTQSGIPSLEVAVIAFPSCHGLC